MNKASTIEIPPHLLWALVQGSTTTDKGNISLDSQAVRAFRAAIIEAERDDHISYELPNIVFVGNIRVALSPKRFALAKYLIDHLGEIVEFYDLASSVIWSDDEKSSRAIETLGVRLRDQLELVGIIQYHLIISRAKEYMRFFRI